MQKSKIPTQPKTYTVAQVTAAVAFAVAVLSAVGQVIALFLPDPLSRWIAAISLFVSIFGVVAGLIASRRATKEQIEQLENERRERKEGLLDEKWARRINIAVAVVGLGLGTLSWMVAVVRMSTWFGVRYSRKMVTDMEKQLPKK